MSGYSINAYGTKGLIAFRYGKGTKAEVATLAAGLVDWFASVDGWTGGSVQLRLGRSIISRNVASLDDVRSLVAELSR
ncbi:hypothetical protein RKD49_005391 [Streptomyces glaucescens]